MRRQAEKVTLVCFNASGSNITATCVSLRSNFIWHAEPDEAAEHDSLGALLKQNALEVVTAIMLLWSSFMQIHPHDTRPLCSIEHTRLMHYSLTVVARIVMLVVCNVVYFNCFFVTCRQLDICSARLLSKLSCLISEVHLAQKLAHLVAF